MTQDDAVPNGSFRCDRSRTGAAAYIAANLAAAIGLFASLPVHAYCTDGRAPSLEAEFADSDAVAIGIATRQHRVRDPRDPEGYVATLYDTTIERAFKGDLPRRIVVRTENTSSRFPMTIGTRYVLFLTNDGARFFVDNCGHSDAVSDLDPGVLPRIDAWRRKKQK